MFLRNTDSEKLPVTWQYVLVLSFIPLNIIWEFFSIFYAKGYSSTLANAKAVMLFIIVITLLNKVKLNNLTYSVLLFIVYICILFPFASDLIYSLSVSSKVFISLLMLPIGYSFIQSRYSMLALSNNIYLTFFIIVAGAIINNILNVGGYTYVDIGFDEGGLEANGNLLTFVLLLAPLYLHIQPKKLKLITFYILFVAIFIMMLLMFRRTAIMVFFFGYSIFILNYGQFRKSVKILILTAVVLVALFPLYGAGVLLKYEMRAEQGRFKIETLLESEARARETPAIWSEIFSFDNMRKSFFGGEAFNSVGMYGGGSFGGRMAHIDYNNILISNGIVGLLLYLNIYFQMYRSYRKAKKTAQNPNYRIYKAVFWVLFMSSLLTSMSGMMYSITFRSIVFLYLGAILATLNVAENDNFEIMQINKLKQI